MEKAGREVLNKQSQKRELLFFAEALSLSKGERLYRHERSSSKSANADQLPSTSSVDGVHSITYRYCICATGWGLDRFPDTREKCQQMVWTIHFLTNYT